MAFKNDIKRGNKGENVVVQVFKRNGIELIKNTDTKNLKDFDLVGKLNKTKITIEVKYDWLCEKTGNLAIEYHNSSKDEPSGIKSTKSKLWAQVITDNGYNTVWLVGTKQLLDFIDKNDPFKIVSKAGDGNAELFLYKENQVLHTLFIRVDNLNTDEFIKTLNKLLK